MKKTTQIPENIKLAVQSLIGEYGYNFDELLLNNSASSPSLSIQYLTVPEAEKYTGVSRFTLIRAQKAGKITAYKLSEAKSGKVLYDKASIDSWILSKKIS